jgi:hypothetical protein
MERPGELYRRDSGLAAPPGPLYGLKQATCQCHLKLRSQLAGMGFVMSSTGPVFFVAAAPRAPPVCSYACERPLKGETAACHGSASRAGCGSGSGGGAAASLSSSSPLTVMSLQSIISIVICHGKPARGFA